MKRNGIGDRVFERGQGCWNCLNAKDPKEFWQERRTALLTKALNLSILTGSQDHPDVINIRRVVDSLDTEVARGSAVRCDVGRTANGEPVGDFVAHNFLCSRWVARDGASLARVNGKLDELPEELADRIEPTSITKMVRELDQK